MTRPFDRLVELVASARRLVVLTGAGCSTESGIPDYRDPDGSWRRGKPMSFRDFAGCAAARRRYWARSLVGWRRIDAARPNPAHLALAELEAAGRVHHLITQNVDGLHQRAGHQRVVDLHGRLDRIECLDCRTAYRRDAFQGELARLNPGWSDLASETRPDGDADLGDAPYEAFHVPPCPRCGGVLKPGVTFFGETIPPLRTAAAFARLGEADALLAVGSSLMVWSGYRFARAAAERGLPLALVNLGRTRADDEATVKVETRCGEALPELVRRLGLPASV